MKVLSTFPIVVDFHLSPQQLKEAMKKLNVFYTGDTECNIKKGNELVSKYPEIEKSNPNFVQSHYNANRCYQQTVQVELLEDGTLQIARFNKVPVKSFE